MSRRPLPTNDSPLSRYAFGTGRLYAGDLANVYKTIRRAYDLGIRHFDASVGYDNATPHAALGRLIREVDEDELFISTKIGHFRSTFPGYKELYRDEAALWGVIHECHRMLRGKLDLLQIHEADLTCWWDPNEPADGYRFLTQADGADVSDVPPLRDAPVVRAVGRARESGVCRYVGVTGNSSVPLSAVASQLAVSLDIDSAMCAYNLDPIFRGAVDAVAPVTREKGLFLMSAGVLQGGSYRRPLHLPESYGAFEEIVERFRRFDEVQKGSGLSAVELLIRWSISVAGIDRWILGASRPEQIEETVQMLELGPLPSDLQAALDGLALHDFDWRVLLAAQRQRTSQNSRTTA